MKGYTYSLHVKVTGSDEWCRVSLWLTDDEVDALIADDSTVPGFEFYSDVTVAHVCLEKGGTATAYVPKPQIDTAWRGGRKKKGGRTGYRVH